MYYPLTFLPYFLFQILHRLNQTAKIADLASQIRNAECMPIDEKAKKDYDDMIKSWNEMDKQSNV